MTRILLVVLLLASALAWPAAPGAQTTEVPKVQTPKQPRETRTRTSTTPRRRTPVSGSVYIGDEAPSFELDGSNGREVRNATLRGEWVVLAFADRWRTIAELDDVTAELKRMGTRVVGICHEKQQTLMRAAERDSLQLLLLADPTGEVSGTYGLFDWTRGETQTGFFVLDRGGIVRLAVIGRIFPPDQMVLTVDFLKGAYQANR
jgi:peroxiredoxin